MKQLFDTVSVACSRLTTRAYSTSFSLGIYCLGRKLHGPIYSIYGFVRFADEIVDSFHDYDKAALLDEFEAETWKAIDRRISLNPILNSFQEVVHRYHIGRDLIEGFLASMRMDLKRQSHSQESYETYILGSAEVVGLMCLRVFTDGNDETYEQLRPAAMKLGAAFQKVNFLRDLDNDFAVLGRTYFPGVNLEEFTMKDKRAIEASINRDFEQALEGIRRLPPSSRFGVYVAYVYYQRLFLKIQSLPPRSVLAGRIRIPNYQKISLLISSYFRHSLRML